MELELLEYYMENSSQKDIMYFMIKLFHIGHKKSNWPHNNFYSRVI